MGLKDTLCGIFASNAASTTADSCAGDPRLSPDAKTKYHRIASALRGDKVDKLPQDEKRVALHLFRRKVARERSDQTIKPNPEGGVGYG